MTYETSKDDENWGKHSESCVLRTAIFPYALLAVYRMLVAGQNLNEPYLRTELIKYQKWQYRHLDEKMNLYVEKACYVMGVIDECGILAGDQVYLKVSNGSGQAAQCVVGDVCITRYGPSIYTTYRTPKC